MARGLGFWVVVMIIMTSVLTREHLLGDHYKIMIIAIAMQWPWWWWWWKWVLWEHFATEMVTIAIKNIDGCDQRLTVTSLHFDDGVKDSCLGFGSLLVQSSWPNDFWTNIFLVHKKTLKVGKSVYLGPGFSIYQTFYPCRSVSAPLKFDI